MVEIGTVEDEDKIELKDEWRELMGEDLVMKVIQSGRPQNKKEPEAVQPQDAVMINFIGRLADDRSRVDGPIFQKVEGWFIIIGDGDVVPALELAIRFMDSGQTACVWSHSKYALSTGTRTFENTKVPSNSNVMYEVTVTQIVLDTSRLNPYFTIQKALNRKNIANDIYQHEWCLPPKAKTDPTCEAAMGRAIRLYQKTAKEMETLLGGTYFQNVEEDHPQRHQSSQLMLDSLNNICAVYLKQKEYNKAKQTAVEVLKLDRKNIKALLRAAKASLLDPASTMEEVKAALKEAGEQITYKNPSEEKELKRLKTQLKRKQHEYKKKTKEMFANKLQTNSLSKDTRKNEKDVTSSEESAAREESSVAISSEEVTETKGTAITDRDIESESEDSKESTVSFISIFIQVLIPLALLLFYRSLSTTTNDRLAPTANDCDEENSSI